MGTIGAIWGFLGFTTLIGMALYRLTPLAVDTFNHELTPLHWIALVVCVVFMAYSEGYKGFQKAFSPRAAARLKYLKEHPKWNFVLFAPLFVMCFFHTTKKRKIVAYCLTSGIIVLILLVHQLDQPWRGVVDVGVVVGLSWGILSFFIFVAKAFGSNDFDESPELPVGAE